MNSLHRTKTAEYPIKVFPDWQPTRPSAVLQWLIQTAYLIACIAVFGGIVVALYALS